MKLANNGQTPRPDYQTAPTAPVVAAAGGLSQPGAAPTLTPRTAGELNLNLSGGGSVLGDGHARGGNGIFGEPKVYIKNATCWLLTYGPSFIHANHYCITFILFPLFISHN